MINAKKQESRPRGSVAYPMEYYKVNTEEPDYNLPYHWHIEFEFIHILRGEYTLFAGTREYVLKSGDYFLMSSGILHGDSERFRGKCVYESLVFDPNIMMINNYVTVTFLERLIEGENYFSILQGTDESELSKTLADLFKTVKSKTEGYAYSTISLLFRLLGYIDLHRLYERNEHYMKESGKLIWLKCVMNLIKQKYGESISLAQMADSAGFSPKYFCRVFHEVTHYTPMEYLNQYRVNRAAEMLLSTDESIEDIAYDCGFNDISYFIKLFKRYKNKTPLKYRAEGLVESTPVHTEKISETENEKAE